ncbi:hypothetical protein CHU92_10135 [Flavobacterium cyanobacteriorum]|uniref:DUF5723 domain-containing protein n=1 Tax=Flavobacterium cyanobacteriorum TaxID=2022802 RepID=A0A255Z3T4_9FLAO|nr:DUF5723 family protein [Flavobacterium cyanobacteriorum]OYQ36138.1 hypothetical protein CHU92_10135 [Flavobacterium cyanobacteriorum]
MKKNLLYLSLFFSAGVLAQEHFSGINTSRRTGLLNAALNPAELTNLKSDHEVNIFNFSANVANNKITFGDLIDGKNFENLIFSGNEATNLRGDLEILGPSFGLKTGKWGFAVTSGAKIKAEFVDIDVTLGNALINSASDAILGGPVTINTAYNQRASATTWGEIGLSAARELFNNEEHRFTGGVTFKLLFPGSYANMSAERFRGTITRTGSNVELTNANASVNIAYSGSLAEDYTDSSNFTQFFAGGLNGFATDLGVSYQWKDKINGGNILTAGISVRNIGKMTFKDDNNISRTYELNVGAGESLNLNQFEGVEDLRDIEAILENNPNLFQKKDVTQDFKVKLPTVFSAYADVKLYNSFFVTAYTQQKLNEDNDNKQIAIQNIVTVTPRYAIDVFEAYVPLSHNEISGFTAGVGFRLGGFFIGSGSVLSAAFSDTDQADGYLGFRFGF